MLTRLPVILLPVMLLGSGCLNATSEASFIGGREEMICEGEYPECNGKYGGCYLEENQYIQGSFPSQKKLIVNTSLGDYKIRVLFFLEDRLAPGTETEVNWYEPGCSDQYRYQLSKHLSGGDLFEQAGRDQVFEVEQPVVEAGEHLVEIWSDATCRYDLRVEVVQVKK